MRRIDEREVSGSAAITRVVRCWRRQAVLHTSVRAGAVVWRS